MMFAQLCSFNCPTIPLDSTTEKTMNIKKENEAVDWRVINAGELLCRDSRFCPAFR